MTSMSMTSMSASISTNRPYSKYVSLVFMLAYVGVLVFINEIDSYDEIDNESYDEDSLQQLRGLKDGKNALTGHKYTSIFVDPPPLFPLTSRTILGFTLSVFGLLLAAGGGIGGGGILVPLYTLVLSFTPKHAIPLSNITVFGGSLANFILNSSKRHPLADRPLVDWDLILVMEPVTILGALIGAIVNKLLNDVVLAILLVVLLTLTANNSLKKAVKMYKKETKEIEKRKKQRDIELAKIAKEQEEGLLQSESTSLLPNPAPETLDPELLTILTSESTISLQKVTSLTALFICILILNVLKGGGYYSPLGIHCGSPGWWFSNLLMFLLITLFMFNVRTTLIKKYHTKQRLNFKYVPGDIQWSERNTIVYPLICTVAGGVAGMFGVGGGIVKGPLMLAMNVHPKVSGATSATMILYTSFTATTSFFVFGLVVKDYAVVCFFLGFIATWVGQVGMTKLMEGNERNSYIAFSIGGVVAVSAVMMGVQSIISLAEGKTGGGGGGICG
ncbi:hypothetical protein TrST_g7246 [Triparma strigata]|uniref:Sulfite exporter TauE/SafE family protein n=1 Tax=Triparma strigata TaxID=1606541 RepID=A0A9W7BS43_9STRA|nr:hypothetical protein TrST_g7246 [Triparma strigata]